MAQNVTLLGASYPNVPAVDLPKTGGGTARFTDVSGTTAAAADVASGKVFYAADGTETTGTASGGGGNPMPYAMRPDAEKIITYTYDKLYVEDGVGTFPSYTSTATTIKTASSFESISIDLSTYDYFVMVRMLAYPIYNSTSVAKGRAEYYFGSTGYEVYYRPKNTLQALVNGTKKVTSDIYGTSTYSTFYRTVYWSSGSTLTTSTSVYGPGYTTNPPTVSATALTVKEPTFTIRGNSSCFTSTYWGYMTDARYQYIIDVYKAPRTQTIQGWAVSAGGASIVDAIVNNGGTLR